jgi:hypothetical protein
MRDPQEYLDRTPCTDYFGDRSTVGFEKLWLDILREIRRPYHKTHDIRPWDLRCNHCGRSEVEIHLEKLRCDNGSGDRRGL